MPAKACLVMMLRDESENLRRCLRSIESLYEHYCIGIDRQTTDDTGAIVRDWMRGREDQGIISYFDWPEGGFAASRNLHLDLALQHYPECQFCLSVDGDDVLDPRSRPIIQAILEDAPTQYLAIHSVVYLDEDDFGLPYLMYPRPIMLLNRADVRYKGAAHNVINVPEETQLVIDGIIVHHRQAPKKRAMREQQRIERNMPALLAAAEADPTDSRSIFYAANTALDSGDQVQAEALYTQYLTIAPWPNERYQVRLHLAAIRFIAGDTPGAIEHLWAALREPDQWNRAEAYVHLADCALADGKVPEAIHWMSIAGEMAPPISSMFLNGAIYTWLPHWRLALLLDKLGAHGRALQHAKRAYQWRPAPEFKAAIDALEATVAAIPETNGNSPALDPGLHLATQITPLPPAEMDRLIAEIPRWSPNGADGTGQDRPEDAAPAFLLRRGA